MDRRVKRNRDSVVVLLLIMFLMLGVNVSGLKVNAKTWGDYKYGVLEDETVIITGYTGKGSVLEIPDTIDNKKVTSIGDYAFCDCSELTSVTIPEGVTSIGDNAFTGCSGLTSVTIPEGVTSIGWGAFSDCSSLTSVTIPEGVTSIEGHTFFGCSGLTSVIIPNSVISIGEYTFSFCNSLTSISVAGGNLNYSSETGVLFDKDKSELICYPEGKKGTYIIPNSVTSIGRCAFDDCSGLTGVTIPESVTSIGINAFAGCSSLTSVTIPKSVTSIDLSAFAGCSSLTSISVAEGNLNYSSETGVLFDKDKSELICYPEGKKGIYIIPNSVISIRIVAFSGCSGLTSVTIPESVTSIEEYAFYGCSGLTNMTIPKSVTSIGESAFGYCSGLTSVTITKSVTSIGLCAFEGCDNVTLIVEKDSYAEQYAKDDDIPYQYMEIENPGNTTEEPTTEQPTTERPATEQPTTEQPTSADYVDFLDIENSSVSVKTAKPGDTITWSFKIKEGYQATDANLCLEFPSPSSKMIYNTTIRNNGDYVDISYIVPEIGQNGTYHVAFFQMCNGDQEWLCADDVAYDGAYDFQPLNVTISGMLEDNTPPDVKFDEISVSISDKKLKIYIPAKDDLSGVDEVEVVFHYYNRDMNEWEDMNWAYSWFYSDYPEEWTVLPDGYVAERNLDDFMQTAEKLIGHSIAITDIFAIAEIGVWDVAGNFVYHDYIDYEVTGIDGLPSYSRFTVGGEDGENGTGNTTEQPEQPTPADYGDFLDIENSSVSAKTAKPGDTITWSFKIKEGYQVINANLYLQFPNNSGKSIYNTTIRDNGDYVDISYIVPEIGQNGTYHVSLFEMRNGDKGWLYADDGTYDFQPLDVTISGMLEDNTPPDVKFDEIRVSISDKKLKLYVPAKDDLSGVDEVGGIFYIFNKDMNEWESLNWGWYWSFSISPEEWTVLPDGYMVERNLDDFMQTAGKIIGREVISTDIFAINYIRIWDVAGNFVYHDYIDYEVTGIDGLPSYLRFTVGGEDKDITDEKPSEGSMPENPVTSPENPVTSPENPVTSPENPVTPPVQEPPVTTPTGSTPAVGSILIVTKDQCRVKVLSADNENPTVAYIGTTNKKVSKLKVPDTVMVDNVAYSVVSVADGAFKNNKKLNSITIGKNIKAIGKNAFSGCKNLKKITIKSTVLESVGKNAIKGIHKKAVIKCPKKQLKQYKKLFKKSTGYKSSMKIKK